jgi:hypothetical protein
MQVETFFWFFTGIGAVLAVIAIAYRLGHTVGFQQAAALTLPQFEFVEKLGCVEMTTDAAVIEDVVPVEQQEEVVISA